MHVSSTADRCADLESSLHGAFPFFLLLLLNAVVKKKTFCVTLDCKTHTVFGVKIISTL
jgi:hypothetical protein